MDLVQFFEENYIEGENGYYDNFYFTLYTAFQGILNFSVNDIDDLISNWKSLLYPSKFDDDDGEVFYGLLSFWLYKNGYHIEEHPNIFSKLKSRSEVSNNDLKNATQLKFGANGQAGGVAWKDRRIYIDSLVVKKSNESLISLDADLESIISLVSSRNSKFESMEINEKLANIRNAFENIGKINGKYLQIPFDSLTNNFITPKQVLDFQSELQCFRHGEVTMIAKRDSYSYEQKQFFVDFGLTILKLAHLYIKNLKK